MKLFAFITLFLLLGSTAIAHPVSFQGSKGIMGNHSAVMSHNQINYSWRHWFATGIHHYKRLDVKNRHATMASTNFLLYRLNGEALQANLYGVLGAGASELSGQPKTAGMGLVQFDIEDRDYYFLAKHHIIANDDQTELKHSLVRAGITPYVDPYDGFHTWIILEYNHSEHADGLIDEDLTPMLRFFYRNFLWEIGQSFKGSTKLNYIVHF